MSLLHLVPHCLVRACMLCCGVLQLWQSMVSARVAVEEGHLCALFAPFLVAVSDHCACDFLALALCLWSGMRSSVCVSINMSSAWSTTHQRLQLSTPVFFICQTSSGSTCCANPRNLGSYFLWALLLMFCRAGRATRFPQLLDRSDPVFSSCCRALPFWPHYCCGPEHGASSCAWIGMASKNLILRCSPTVLANGSVVSSSIRAQADCA